MSELESQSKSSSLIKKAHRAKSNIKMGMAGPAGSGKTYSALTFAKGLVRDMSKVVVIDTENGSANFYSQLGDYSVLPFEPPFDPRRYSNAIQMCVDEGFECIIVDSISPEWEGTGGCLDIHTKLGGRFQDWATVTPMHKAFLDSILQAKAHVICTLRKKHDYAMTEKNGKKVVEKMGMKEIQRDGVEYEFTINFDINMEHLATASKDRTGLFADPVPFKITEKTGELVKSWCLGEI